MMQSNRQVLLMLLLLSNPLVLFAQYSNFFGLNTLRVDFFHSGTSNTEYFSIDQIYEEGPWPGSKHALLDTLNLGQYLVKVHDVQSNELVYSRTFSTIFHEWQTTDAAVDGEFCTMHETVRFPFPRRAVKLILAKRDKQNQFVDLYSRIINPDSFEINRESRKYSFKTKEFLKNGDPAEKVDIVIIGDGYSKKDRKKFFKDVEHYVSVLFRAQPFHKRKKDFNVWVVEAISKDSGIDEPTRDKWRTTALSASYNSLGSPRYVLTLDNKSVRDIASLVPYDYIYILINSPRYGGGGIYNLYATCFTGAESPKPIWWSDYVFVHEFGHSFAGLADEYYSSSVAYNDFYPENVEPWEPNITALLDKDHVKWAHHIQDGTPIPTSWRKATYDSLDVAARKVNWSEGDSEQMYKSIEERRHNLLETEKYAGQVGCFEGAGYVSEGMYRPYLDCRMFSKSLVEFCPVCQEAIEEMIDFVID